MRLREIPVGRAAIAALTAVLVFTGCAQRRPPTVVHTRVPVVTAVPGTVAPSNTLVGIIVPFQNVAIQNSLSEPTLAVTVQAGDHVTKGQVLARLDTSDLVANLKATLANAAANRAKWQQTYLQ